MSDITQQLRQETQRLSTILNLSPNPVWQRDSQLNIVYCNEAFLEIAEPDSDELIDLSEMELFRGHRDMAQAANDMAIAQSDEKYIITNGQRRLYRITEVPAGDGSVNGYAVDISEIEAAREETQRHQTAQRDFLESTTSAMAVFGRDQRLQLYNAAFSRFWQLDENFLDHTPTYGEILERLREHRRLPEQSNFPAFKQSHLKWFTDLIEPHEEFFYLPDGKTLRVLIIPHALGGLLFVYEDVTDRLALERSYNTLIAVQQETLDNIHESVMVIGEDGRIKLCNPAFLRLWQVDESAMNAQPHLREALEWLRPLLIFDHWEDYREDFIARAQHRENERGKIELQNGTILAWRRIALPDGGTLLTHNDVTDTEMLERSLRERNQALEAADKLKTEFLANVSYELRSPLTSISGFSDILQQEYFGTLTDKQREYIEGIQLSSQQLSALISNILDLASIEAGYLKLNISEFDVCEMIEGVANLIRERARALRIDLSIDCPQDIGHVRADETRLRQVIFNLLSNALKYSDSGGEVRLRVNRTDEWLEICVEDSGVGIEADQQALIFERFYRAGAVRGQQSGSGLGLSIVKSFVELHGGSVLVESTPGKGTCFTCQIPFTA